MTTPHEPTVHLKAFAGFEVKDEAKGEVEAIVATLGVLDHDHEVITHDAVDGRAKVKLSAYGHGAMYGDMPVGKGTIESVGDHLRFRGKFFLSTTRGAEAFATVKEFGADQEWSFGFRVLKWEEPDEAWRQRGAFRILTKLDPFEVSPVILGAGVGTRTVSAKAVAPGPADPSPEEIRRVAADLEAKALAETEQAGIAAEFARFRRNLHQFGLA
jgi:phage head maturation protease